MKKLFLLPLLLTFLYLLPSTIPSSHAQLVGEVCLTAPGDSNCPASPPVFSGTPGTQLRVAIFIQASEGILGFDVTLLADHTILKPASADVMGTVLTGSLTILANCIGGVAVQGNCRPEAAGQPDTLELAVAGQSNTASPTTGLLFTATYNITGTTSSINLGYQTGCNDSSVSGTTTCVTTANGNPPPVPETAQAATFSNNGFTLSASPSSLTVRRGNGPTSVVTVTPNGGFTGTVNLSATTSPGGKKAPTASLASPTVTITSGPVTDILTVNVPNGTTIGTYTITITGSSATLTRTTTIAVTVTK